MANREETSAVGRRLETLATTLSSDYKALIAEIRKSLVLISGIAVSLEKEQQSDMVEQLDDAVLELLETSSDCTLYSHVIQAVFDGYQRPQENQLTDFNVIMESEFNQLKSDFVSVPQSDPLYRKFKESVWNVHHAGQPMPGEEQDDIVMTSTQGNLLNMKCPLTGLHVFHLGNPVRCKDCKHIYEKDAIMNYMTKNSQAKCPVAGCPKVLQVTRVVCDPMLTIEIDEARARGDETVEAQMVEDFGEGDSD
ncbi:E3 SUMO-protein ligase MMS21 [Zostera marina]|uniref:E3 SUMO-protein ligase MMS21 n=1 Tax=Zostera marina TaxID=29655 RepID=A0A0K9NX39_ZOSMR|nr:E3 SUMO-protein ligase MMS21 [Zostera marina]